MPRIPDTTDSQSQFLRALAKNPLGPPADQWPRPAVLRRWLRKDTFRRALDSLRETLRYEADLHLAYASTGAAQSVHRHAQPAPKPDSPMPEKPAAPAPPAPPAEPQPQPASQQQDAPASQPQPAKQQQDQASQPQALESRLCTDLLKLSHLRQRFSPKPKPPEPPQIDWEKIKNEEIDLFRRLCPDRPLGEAIRFIEDRRAALRARGVLPPLLPKSAKPNSTPTEKAGPQ